MKGFRCFFGAAGEKNPPMCLKRIFLFKNQQNFPSFTILIIGEELRGGPGGPSSRKKTGPPGAGPPLNFEEKTGPPGTGGPRFLPPPCNTGHRLRKHFSNLQAAIARSTHADFLQSGSRAETLFYHIYGRLPRAPHMHKTLLTNCGWYATKKL